MSTAAMIPERLARIEALSLKKGGHEKNAELAMCTMEMVAWVAGEPWSDAPQCACPVITGFCVSWNDSLPSDEARDRLLKPLIPLIVGTRSTSAVEEKRSYLALDWLIRVYTPKWLDMVPALHERAKELRELDAIVDMAGATAAGVKVRSASTDAAAAWAAAGAAARDAARGRPQADDRMAADQCSRSGEAHVRGVGMTTASRHIDPRNNSVVLTPASIEIPADWALVQTEEEKLAQDRAHAAFKNDPRWGDLSVQFAHSEEVHRSRGA